MSSTWLREIKDSNSGAGTGAPFLVRCLAYFLTEICGFTDYVNGSSDEDFKTEEASGTNGEFNISGTDKDFRDTVASGFTAGMVNAWLVVADANRLNAGIYLITGYTDATRITVDFRSGAAEYPAQTTGVSWWVISGTPAAATGTITGKDGTTVSDGDWIRVDDGDTINDAKVVIFSRQDPGTYSPNQWRGGVIAEEPFEFYNDLVGKVLNFSVGGVSKVCTFTGSSPLTGAQIVSQINAAAGQTVCHLSTSKGYEDSNGKHLTWRTYLGSVWGKPNDPPSSDGNNVTLTYSGSTAWTELGLTGTGDKNNPSLAQDHYAVDNVADPDYDDASEIAEMIKNSYNGHNWLSANRSGSTVNLSNDYDGAHGNKTIESSRFGVSGMSGGTMGSMDGNFFRCRTPHANGWEVEVAYRGSAEGGYQHLEFRVSTNADWTPGSGKVIGPVKFGADASNDLWLYAFGDDAGEYLTVAVHNDTGGQYLGAIVSNLIPADYGLATAEQVALMGCKGSDYEATEDRFNRGYDVEGRNVGHGYQWWDRAGQVDLWMADLSASGYSDTLTQWSSRESNARRSNASGFTQEDVIAGTYVIADPQNENNLYSIVGKISGLYSVREGIGDRTTFDEASSGASDFIHFRDGIAFEWPEVTPQH